MWIMAAISKIYEEVDTKAKARSVCQILYNRESSLFEEPSLGVVKNYTLIKFVVHSQYVRSKLLVKTLGSPSLFENLCWIIL
jgi:hypothetical protein